MPLYEYRCVDPAKGCRLCRAGIEHIAKGSADELKKCPVCGASVRRIFSSFSVSSPVTTDDEDARIEHRIKDYEKAGMFSHAAELADKSGMKERAMENYKKAGYDV